MDTENLKIKTYSTAIKNLPDYPSDAGYTAAMLKEAFDARSDNEIKEKHNALIDALNEELAALEAADGSVQQTAKEYSDGLVSAHNTAEGSHSDIRSRLLEMGSEIAESKTYADALVEKLKSELGIMESDNGLSEKMVRRANSAFCADESSYANQAHKDSAGRVIYTTYATKDELGGYVKDTDLATEEKAGIVRLAKPEEMGAAMPGIAATPLAVEVFFNYRIDGIIGDISSALDELHVYAEALVGGAE